VNPLSLTYGALSYARNLLFDTGFFSAHLQGPVVSVGSISAGGAGKTPLVIRLGELLKARQATFDVLSRGYGRKSKGVRLVKVNGEPDEFGDEPLLIARRLGVPVVVGENRYHAGLLAEQKFGPQLHLLDDGFQHRALARDFDVVLFTARENSDRLLPVGRLREPLASLGRADAIVLVNNTELPAVQLKPAAFVWRVRRKTVLESPTLRPLAFCGIARSEQFFAELRELGVSTAAEIAFPDHHAYSEADVERLLATAREKSADGFITTEKDLINLGPLVKALQPLVTAKVQIELEEAEAAVSMLLEAISARG
jgi:tetraacyldisaccharide 4'-kinase